MNKPNEEKLRIESLLNSGKISQDDYMTLLQAIEGSGTFKKGLHLLINPFEALSSTTCLGLGIVFTLVMCFLSLNLGIYFPGALDLQIRKVAQDSTFTHLFTQTLVAVLSLTVCFMIGAIAFKKRNLRFIDFLSFTCMARIPYAAFVIIATFLRPIIPSLIPNPQKIESGGGVIVLALLSTTVLVWHLLLLFNAQKTASGLKGAPLWVSFIGGTVVAEVVAILLNQYFLK